MKITDDPSGIASFPLTLVDFSHFTRLIFLAHTLLLINQGPDFDDMSSLIPREIDDGIQYSELL